MIVQLFIPCFIDQLYPQTAFNMAKVLEKASCDVRYNTNQTCCGQPAFNAGFWDDARDVASKFLKDFDTVDFIVAPSASCVGFVRNYYSKLFEDSASRNQVIQLGKRIYEFTEFLTEVLKIEKFDATFPGLATYHDSCAALRDQINMVRDSIKKEPPLNPNESLILGLFETGCIRFGQFTLASGATSPIYIDLRRLVSFPDLFSQAAEAYAERSRAIQYDLLSGVPYAALPISAVAALRLHKGMIYPRKEAKTHGTGQSIEGVFTQGQVALLYEDVITSGGSILAAAGVLRAAGLIVRDVVVLVNRSQGGREALAADGITLHAILTMDEILDVLEKKQLVAADLLQQVKSYIKGQA